MAAGLPQCGYLKQNMIADTWYTVVNYIGKGAFSEVKIHHGTDNRELLLRITIDGVAAPTIETDVNELWRVVSDDLAGVAYKIAHYNWGLVGFDTSLKVEVRSGDAGLCYTMVLWQIIA